MRKIIFTLFAALLAIGAWAQAPAFPGAEGVARLTTTGGRGGKILHVTNLNDSGTGSLRAACQASGPRIVVFDVSGIIELRSALKINNDNITIEGQTAPGDGICLKNYTFSINCNNAIIRFIRARMGDEAKSEDDAMNGWHHDDSKKKNVIIDHCTMSWSTDECGSFYGIENFTLQWCMLSESLVNSVHGKGAHGYGGIWGGKNAAFHHNLLAHHTSRNPRFDHDYVSTMKGPIDYVNNVVYNWGDNSSYGGESANTSGEYRKINMINNYYKAGPATSPKERIVNPTTNCKNCTGETSGLKNIVPGHFYINGNYVYNYPAITADNWSGNGVRPDDTSKKSAIKSDTRFVAENSDELLSMHPAETAFDQVLEYAGASYVRDDIDSRIAQETQTGTFTYTGSNGSTRGGMIDTQTDAGGWPAYKQTEKLADSDNDGMPDIWEEAMGLDKSDATDAQKYTLDPQGYYTNIEVYCNSLVEDLMMAENEGADFLVDEYYPEIGDKVDGVPYYGSVSYQGEEPADFGDGTEGTIVWNFDKGTANQKATFSAGIADKVKSTSVSIGSQLAYDGTKNVNGLVMTLFKNANADSFDKPTADNTVTFSVEPADGYAFQATNVAFDISKFGTDSGNFTAKWDNIGLISGDGTINRNNAEGGYYSHYSLAVNNASPKTDATNLVLNLYNIYYKEGNNPPSKQIGLANIVITGQFFEDTGVRNAENGANTVTAIEYYNMQGMRLDGPQEGILICKMRMANGRTVTRKIVR